MLLQLSQLPFLISMGAVPGRRTAAAEARPDPLYGHLVHQDATIGNVNSHARIKIDIEQHSISDLIALAEADIAGRAS